MAQLALQLLGNGEEEQALLLAERAKQLEPLNGEVGAIVASVRSHSVPTWHFNIVKDSARNAAYEAAIRRAVTPHGLVLDVGAGTSLLAMMAARAGATNVVSCEMNPAIAAAATDIVTANGFSDRIRVLSRHSDDLKETDLGGRAQVLVSEIVSNNMLSERALPALESVCRRLVLPNATIIPDQAIVRVALAEDVRRTCQLMPFAEGFDLNAFNRLEKPLYPIPSNARRIQLRSPSADLFSFDFYPGVSFKPARTRIEFEATGGDVNGIVQWIRLRLDAETSYENDPQCGYRSAWANLFYPLTKSITTRPGDKITVGAAHDTVSLRIWTD